MEQYLEIVKQTHLFDGIDTEDMNGMLMCLGVRKQVYKKGEFVIHAGGAIDFIGIVLKGTIRIIKTDVNGNENMISEVIEGGMFAEVFACADVYHSPFSIIACKDSELMLLNYRSIITTCNSSCEFHQKIVFNMLKIVAKKSLYLNQKIDVISQKTLREKLLCYFDYVREGKKQFTIQLNREQLANYLCAERSAVSNELSKMQKDGVIRYCKNEIELR